MIHSPEHPGWLLGEELKDRGISISQAAADLGVSRQTISRVVHGSQPITAEMAAKLGCYFGGGAALWVRMQAQHELWNAQQHLASELKKIPAATAA
jgi:antitoxin HigA-1